MKRKLAENLKRVQRRIEQACERCGREPHSVKLVAVTKYASLDLVRALVELGVPVLAESRVQDLVKRAAAINEWLNRRGAGPAELPAPTWHMVGHLQRNKVKALLPWIGMIHSVDSLRLAEEIDAQAARIGRRIPILLEINASGETSKQGVAVAATTHLAEQITSLSHIELRGLMTMAPLTDDVTLIRHTFERVREVFEEIVVERLGSPSFRELSMGMSNDFEHGIESGATYVRIGTALFEGLELAPQPAEVE